MKLAIKRLKILENNPSDMERIVLDVLQSTSVAEFNIFFKQLHINLRQLPRFNLTTDNILTMGNEQYSELVNIGIWNGKNKSTSSFSALSDERRPEDTSSNSGNNGICPRCGKSHPNEKCKVIHWRRANPNDGEPTSITMNGKAFFH